MTETKLNVDEHILYSASEIICCRICHEAEFESCKSLESPCSCSGTVKFAHRDCVQRWCDEKGNTNCEICLQKFEPGYSATDQNSPVTTIREYAECSSTAAHATASMCRTLILILTMLLLATHFIGALIGETEDYPFTLLTLIVVKACGILLPMYVIMRIIDVVHNIIIRQYPESERDNI